MALYIHIPFCKQACHYCNFHFSTSLRHKTDLLSALQQEIALRHEYLATPHLSTIYIGGGTPSLLTLAELQALFQTINTYFVIAPDAEITLEANPDDLTKEKIAQLRQTPINRLSIGIQSFDEADLQFMHRAHNTQQAQNCIQLAQEAGFHNLSIDLIYGSPTTSNAIWQHNLERVFGFRIPHISAYCLTIEPKTALEHFVKHQKVAAPNEEQAAQQFEILCQMTQEAGYQHYEISNFCLPNQHARHNTSYWQGKHYLGIGPSAHSFNGHSRQWNIANNAKYIEKIGQKQIPAEIEQLTLNNQYNEYVMTSLRTIWGSNLQYIQEQFGAEFQTHFLQHILPFEQERYVMREKQHFRLTFKGKLLADKIAMNLFR